MAIWPEVVSISSRWHFGLRWFPLAQDGNLASGGFNKLKVAIWLEVVLISSRWQFGLRWFLLAQDGTLA